MGFQIEVSKQKYLKSCHKVIFFCVMWFDYISTDEC